MTKLIVYYFSKKFFIFSKGNFETMVGLEEEYRENADEVISTLEKTNLIEGIELVKDEAQQNKNLLKTIASIAKKQNHSSFNNTEIKKMKSVLKKMEGKDLKVPLKIKLNWKIKRILKIS